MSNGALQTLQMKNMIPKQSAIISEPFDNLVIDLLCMLKRALTASNTTMQIVFAFAGWLLADVGIRNQDFIYVGNRDLWIYFLIKFSI